MPALSRFSKVALATAVAAVASKSTVCTESGCPAEEPDDHALLAITAKAMKKQPVEQRADDLVPVGWGKPVKPKPFAEHLDVPEPFPAPNPKDNPLINGYIPQNCYEENWPFFSQIPGTWVGDMGQNFIALPQADAMPEGKDFLVQVNRYNETLHFEKLGPVLNRGYLNGWQTPEVFQSDQVFMGVTYLQQIDDMDLDFGIHEENGFFLHQSCRPVNAGLLDPWQVTRLGSIPHGSQPMGFGNITEVHCPDDDYYLQTLLRLRQSAVFSVQPWVPGCGPRYSQQRSPGNNSGPLMESEGLSSCCIGGGGYMKGKDQCPDSGCPEPIDQLIAAVNGLNVISYVQIDLTTEDTVPPVTPMGKFPLGVEGGGVQNTAFVNRAAESEPRSFRNMNWLLTVQREDGSKYNMLQYIQTVDIRFLNKGPSCPDQLWPHVDANTLYKVDEPKPTPEPTPEPTPAPEPEPNNGKCFNRLCGCPKKPTGAFTGGSWCNHERCWLGPICSRSEKACHACMGEYCPK